MTQPVCVSLNTKYDDWQMKSEKCCKMFKTLDSNGGDSFDSIKCLQCFDLC